MYNKATKQQLDFIMTNPEKTRKHNVSTESPKKTLGDSKQLHVNIPIVLHKKFRIKVLEEGRSMGQVIEELIKDYVNQ